MNEAERRRRQTATQRRNVGQYGSVTDEQAVPVRAASTASRRRRDRRLNARHITDDWRDRGRSLTGTVTVGGATCDRQTDRQSIRYFAR